MQQISQTIWPFRMKISNAFGSCGNTLSLSTNFASSKYLSSSFTISGKIVNSYCHGTDLKNNNGSLQFLSGPCPFFQVNLKCQWTHPLPWEIILIYWLCRWTVQPFLRWGNTQLWCDHSWLALAIFVFLQESLAKVLTNESAPFTKARFQNINKRLRCIKVGNGPLIIFVTASDWPTTNFLEKFCHFPVTKLVNFV